IKAVLDTQQFDMGGFAIARAAHQRLEDEAGLLEHRCAIGDDISADCCAQDDHEFPRLPEHFDMPAHRCIPAKDAGKHNDDTNYETHGTRPERNTDLRGGTAFEHALPGARIMPSLDLTGRV